MLYENSYNLFRSTDAVVGLISKSIPTIDLIIAIMILRTIGFIDYKTIRGKMLKADKFPFSFFLPDGFTKAAEGSAGTMSYASGSSC